MPAATTLGLQRVPNTASVEEVAAILKEHGHVVIEELVSRETMEQLGAEMQPHLDATPLGSNEGFGLKTRRTGRLIERSPTGRSLVMHPLVQGVIHKHLGHAHSIQLGATEMISLDPGAAAQFIHRDEMVFESFPFPADYEVSCNSIWAVTDFTEENGATRVVPGSHKVEPKEYQQSDTVPAEMKAGSVMIFSGKLWHGGGTNNSDAVRHALAINTAVGWLRQEENQYLSCSREVARTLPEDLLHYMGYQQAYGYGHAGGQKDPLAELMQG